MTAVAAKHPGITSLRDTTQEMLESVRGDIDQVRILSSKCAE